MTMAEIGERIRSWASTVTAGLALAIIIGGVDLKGRVDTQGAKVEALTILAQATEVGKQGLDNTVAGIEANIEGLRRDIDRVGQDVKKQADESAKDRSEILQAIGRLEGARDSNGK